MKIGFPTHPRKNIVSEIQWIGENGFDFAELFFEPDQADHTNIKPVEIRRVLDDYGLDALGHTAWYLPLGSAIKELRTAAVNVVKTYIEISAQTYCKKLAVHANWPKSLFTSEEGIRFQTESLQQLAQFAAPHGIKIIYESLGSKRDSIDNIRKVLMLNPDIDFHADIGHINIAGTPVDFLVAFKKRLSHIHMHDNDGIRDLHLPIGAGSIDWNDLLKTLKSFYDGTITIEVFSRDKDYAVISQKKLREKWDRIK